MNQITLAMDLLPRRLALLNAAGLHWLSMASQDCALVLGRQFLSAMPAGQNATLICAGEEEEPLMSSLESGVGPVRLALFQLSPGRRGAGLKRLRHELERASQAKGVLLLMLPAVQLQGLEKELVPWALELEAWLSHRQRVMLVLCHGPGPQMSPELAGRLSGLARLEPEEGGFVYQVYGWRNELGLLAGHRQELELARGRFGVPPSRWRDHDIDTTGSGCLIQRAALLNRPAPADNWRVSERAESFWQQALAAREASVVVAVEHNGEVVELARHLHRLRTSRGSRLVVAVRELTSCLRHADQQLLLHCGANLIIPAQTPHTHFLLLLNCLQGQSWHRPLVEEPDALLRKLYPPRARGLQSPHDFLHLVEEVQRSAAAEIRHQLLELPIRGGLAAEQCLGQLKLRREGDLACLLDGYCYLFLFACRDDGLEAALSNICRLPWTDLFSERRVLPGPEALPRKLFEQAVASPVTEVATGSEPESGRHGFFLPRPIALTRGEINS
ncbi:BcsE family c-di-GMP-binding protein [Zobellella sp. DQSA1]|uniref:BcsE family c-di-GMP-binding protein n=1 Tax=Zobellella sp. DQSA1 TaxID=3342386 RepID=UPI0035C1D5A9